MKLGMPPSSRNRTASRMPASFERNAAPSSATISSFEYRSEPLLDNIFAVQTGAVTRRMNHLVIQRVVVVPLALEGGGRRYADYSSAGE